MIVLNVPDAVAKGCSGRPVPVAVVVFAFVVGFAPPARIVPRDLLPLIGAFAAAVIGPLL